MTPYRQRDYFQQLGTCNTTIAREGCAITCCGILSDTPPPDVNNLGCYNNGCLADWGCLANKLNLDYDSRRDIPVKYPCIAEVVLSGFQHFIVLKDENTQIDPWTGQEGGLKYTILSYRNLTIKEQIMTAGTYKKDFSKMSPRDQHFMACYWAYLSIKRKEPTDDKVWKLVDKYPDIQELRKVLLKEMCDKEHPCVVEYLYNGSKTQDCDDELEEQKIAYESQMISIRDELESKLRDCQKIVKDRQGIYEVCEGKSRNRWWYFKKFWGIN